MSCALCEVVRAGGTPGMRVAELRECVVVLGENQGCPGWCVCVLREHVEHMDEMPAERQERVFGEVARVARAVRAASVRHGWGGDVTPPRINYECLGNVVAHVHWHVVPRHANDPTPRAPVWGWSEAQLRGLASDSERAAMARAVREAMG